VLYLGEVLADAELMARLGKHKTGKGCLYIKTLDDVDRKVLKELVTKAVAMTRKRMETQ
jgi:predicted GIY-YIG superfamily endonuclease